MKGTALHKDLRLKWPARTLSSLLLAMLVAAACQDKENYLFTRLDPETSGVTFENRIQESADLNILTYEYTYNGGGIAAADFNNDGLCDLYFSGNTVENRLYLNKGGLKFKDVSKTSGTTGRSLWKTGVTAADVNGDGWLDIYVCYSGPDSVADLSNQLFINNGGEEGSEPTFTEMAKEFGIDAPGTYSTQASFLDYDLDGDLDMFLINHGTHFYSPFINTNQLRSMRHAHFGNRLYRNDIQMREGTPVSRFTEVGAEAGIHGGGINFGLGLSVGDVNDDGWPDIFVTNDYEEQDFLYLNNQDGTFRDCTKESFAHLSRNGMGSDIADFNNDGRLDLIEVDMWPEDNFRQKLLKGPDDYNRYMLMLDSGFHHQQMRNTLQLNSGINGDGVPEFSEIGQLAGVSATDWSWAPLFVDVDNDGFKDLFVTNGYLRDFTSMDFLKYTVEEAKRNAREQNRELKLYELVSQMPSTRTSDYLFRNNGDLTFSNFAREWGLDIPNLSFGATYADLDNDGDLELIVNQTNETASIWVNHATDTPNASNFIQISLKGSPDNPGGIGARILLKCGENIQMQEKYLTRGYQSSVDPVIHFGLGKAISADMISVIWPDRKLSLLSGVKSNQRILIDYSSAVTGTLDSSKQTRPNLFTDITDQIGPTFIHRENAYNDFDREPLIPLQLSRLGPPLAKADVNGDGIDDFYIGGAIGQSGRLYLGDDKSLFVPANLQPWSVDSLREDTGAVFFDADGDNDSDLFVVTGGNEYEIGSDMLDDRLYINDGKGKFTKAKSGSIPSDHVSGSCVVAGDYDRDGDLDLFVGGRLKPGNFPLTSPGAILQNVTDRATGQIQFKVATKAVNNDLREPGMVTDALFTDFNNDLWPDLIIVGEWMPVRLFENKKGTLIEVFPDSLSASTGLWKKIFAMDVDNDGDDDYILGNAGTNLPWNVDDGGPLTLFYGDFNNDGRIDPIICDFVQGKDYPIASRDELLLQMNSFRKKFTNYSGYASASIEQILDASQLSNSGKLTVECLRSSVLFNLGQGNFRLTPLPAEAQFSSVYGMLSDDYDSDGSADILIAGNFYPYRTQYGPSDAGRGVILKGDGKGNFVSMDRAKFKLDMGGDVRSVIGLKGSGNRMILIIGRNDDKISLIEFHRKLVDSSNASTANRRSKNVAKVSTQK